MLLFTTQLFTVMKLFWAVSARSTADHQSQNPLTAIVGFAAGPVPDREALAIQSSSISAFGPSFLCLHCSAPSAWTAEHGVAMHMEHSGHACIRRQGGCTSARGSICLQAPVPTTAMPFCCGTSLHAYDTPSPPHTGCALAWHTSAWPRCLRTSRGMQAIRHRGSIPHFHIVLAGLGGLPTPMQPAISHTGP